MPTAPTTLTTILARCEMNSVRHSSTYASGKNSRYASTMPIHTTGRSISWETPALRSGSKVSITLSFGILLAEKPLHLVGRQLVELALRELAVEQFLARERPR